MRLKYYIEFMENIEDVRDIADEELRAIKRDVEQHMKKYISYSGARVEEFQLEFGLEE